MKLNRFVHCFALAVLLAVSAEGCRKRPIGVTVLPGSHAGNPNDLDSAKPINPDAGNSNSNTLTSLDLGNTPMPSPDMRKDWPRDAEIFRQYTVHFDFDSSNVKAGEKSKVGSVADYLKSNPSTAVEIDGHCDERGTEEYNRSLGERRALALRETLVQLGVEPLRIDTTSFGKDRPVANGHNEAAWRQNRRGEFLLERPPTNPR
jgi:peptidoglycan-associated lipoprotein